MATRLPELVVGYAVRMRRVAIVVAMVALGAACLGGCGGSKEEAGRPATVDDLSKWMASASDCDVGVTEARAPADSEEAAGTIERFANEASVGASITCETWLSGWIEYYEFPSPEGRLGFPIHHPTRRAAHHS
jgi:hypothetical protein